MREIQLTPTSYIVLGLIADAGEATPYELKQRVDASIGHFWSLPRSQLYAESARLARAGYLTEEQQQEGRRRKLYTLTGPGRDALKRWIDTPTHDFPELRDLAFLKIFFGADPAGMANAQLTVLRPLLESYEAVLATYPPTSQPGPRRTLQTGIDHVNTSIRAWERIARET